MMHWFYLLCAVLQFVNIGESAVVDEIDPKWSRYIVKNLETDYNETIEPVDYPDYNPYYPKTFGWRSFKFEEEPRYMAKIWAPNKKNQYSNEDGRVCGAVLISEMHVMTSCACVVSWLTWVGTGSGAIKRSPLSTQYDIVNEDLNVVFGGMHMNFTHPYKLEKTSKQYYISYRNCGYNAKMESDSLDRYSRVAILLYTPSYENVGPHPGAIFARFPMQSPFLESAHHLQFELYTYNCQPRDPKNPTVAAVTDKEFSCSMEFTECPRSKCNDFTRNSEYQDLINYKVYCLCGPKNNELMLCEGLMGSPIVSKIGFFGMALSPLACHSGREEAAIIFTTFNEVNRYHMRQYFPRSEYEQQVGFFSPDIKQYDIIYSSWSKFIPKKPLSLANVPLPLDIFSTVIFFSVRTLVV